MLPGNAPPLFLGFLVVFVIARFLDRLAWHTVIAVRPVREVEQLAPFAAEGSPPGIDRTLPAVDAEGHTGF